MVLSLSQGERQKCADNVLNVVIRAQRNEQVVPMKPWGLQLTDMMC